MQQQVLHSHRLACPSCGGPDDGQKVSGIVSSGTTHGTSQGVMIGRVRGWRSRRRFVGATVGWAREQTDLAADLAPPQPPRSLAGCVTAVGSTIFALPLLCLGQQAIAQTLSGSPGIGTVDIVLVACLVAILLLVGLFVRGASKRRAAQAEWQRQMSKWGALYYCHRCDGVFIPGVSPLVPSPATRDFLTYP